MVQTVLLSKVRELDTVLKPGTKCLKFYLQSSFVHSLQIFLIFYFPFCFLRMCLGGSFCLIYTSIQMIAKTKRAREGSIVPQSNPPYFAVAISGRSTIHMLAVVFFSPSEEVVKLVA